MIEYAFTVGQRVGNWFGDKTGTVTGMVPGNISTPWYYVQWDNGTEESGPYTADQLTALAY